MNPTLHQEHEAILKAISENKYNLLEQYIQEGKDFRFLTSKMYEEDEGLKLACRKGYLSIVQLLISHHSNIHADDDESLQLACEQGHEDVVKFLIANNANIQECDYRAMRRAIQRGHLPIVKILCEHPHLDIHFEDDEFYRSAHKYKKEEICSYLAEKGANIESVEQFKFIEAIEKNNLNEVKSWIANGININAFNGKAIPTCVEKFNEEMVWYFLEMKPAFENNDHFIDLLMIKACQEGNKEIVNYLFDNFSTNIWLPQIMKQNMLIAIKEGHISIMEILENKGLVISSNYLKYALSVNNLFAAQFIIEKGIELNQNNIDGNSKTQEEIINWFNAKKLSEKLNTSLDQKEIKDKPKI